MLSAYEGETSVFAIGDGAVFMATGREADIVAWLGDSAYVEMRLSVDKSKRIASLVEIERPGVGELDDPVGEDIWKREILSNGTALLPIEVNNEVAVLMASTGIELAPRTLRVTWQLEEAEAPIAPITLIGLGIMLLGALLGMHAAFVYGKKFRSRRNTRGPRRPKPPKPKRAVSQAGNGPLTSRRALRGMKFVGLALSVGMLAGCVPDYQNPIISPKPLEQPGVLTATLDSSQLQRILKEISDVVAIADATLDRESLEVRVTGPALEVRRAAYALAAKSTDSIFAPTKILSGPVQLFLPGATDTWPRNTIVVTGENALQVLVLRQESARDDYKLYQYSDLLPNISFPEVPAEIVGANALKDDNKFLSMDPASLVEGLGNLLNRGFDSPWALLIDPDNQYVSDVSAVQLGLQDTLSNANLSFGHALSESQPVILANSEGGALVALYMIDTYTIIPKEPGDAVAITGDESILLGTGGSATGIETKYGAMLLFNVPASGSDERATLLGATQQLLSAITLGG